MNEKKARKPRPARTTSLSAERQRIIAAERALVPLGSERVAVDAECYGLIAKLITQYKIRKHEVLRKALRVGLKALVQYDYKSPSVHFDGLSSVCTDTEPEEAPQPIDFAVMPQPGQAAQQDKTMRIIGYTPDAVIHDDLDPEAMAVAQG